MTSLPYIVCIGFLQGNPTPLMIQETGIGGGDRFHPFVGDGKGRGDARTLEEHYIGASTRDLTEVKTIHMFPGTHVFSGVLCVIPTILGYPR